MALNRQPITAQPALQAAAQVLVQAARHGAVWHVGEDEPLCEERAHLLVLARAVGADYHARHALLQQSVALRKRRLEFLVDRRHARWTGPSLSDWDVV